MEIQDDKADADRDSFLDALLAEHDVWMFEEDGCIVGRGPNFERYGGEGDPPLPPHAAEAFLVSNDGPDAVRYTAGGWWWASIGKIHEAGSTRDTDD